MAYQLEGRLLEVCTCNILCPCWVGEDPDSGVCDGTLGWHVDKGTVDGVDVSGHSIVALCHIPGNILKGNWNIRLYVDDKASDTGDFRTQSGHYALAGEGLAVGRDTGDPISKEYEPGFAFAGGQLNKVLYDIGKDMYVDAERKVAAALARD